MCHAHPSIVRSPACQPNSRRLARLLFHTRCLESCEFLFLGPAGRSARARTFFLRPFHDWTAWQLSFGDTDSEPAARKVRRIQAKPKRSKKVDVEKVPIPLNLPTYRGDAAVVNCNACSARGCRLRGFRYVVGAVTLSAGTLRRRSVVSSAVALGKSLSILGRVGKATK